MPCVHIITALQVRHPAVLLASSDPDKFFIDHMYVCVLLSSITYKGCAFTVMASALDCHSKGPVFELGPGRNFKCGCISPQAHPAHSAVMSRLGIYSVEGRAARDRPTNALTMPKALKWEGASTSHRYGCGAYACDLYNLQSYNDMHNNYNL